MLRNSLILPLLLAGSAIAGGASHWKHTSEADFRRGTLRNVVATNLGDLKLSRAMKSLLESEARITAVYSLTETPDGTTYAGTGPNGALVQLKEDKASVVATLDDGNLFCLRSDPRGGLLVGTGGERGRVLRLEKPDAKPTVAFAAEGVQYVWSIVCLPDGGFYAATGPNGQIFQVNADGTSSVLVDTEESNILSLTWDGKDTLYAGSDPNGLVYRINRKTKEAFVLFDAPEAEVACLALDAKGNLYAGTAEATEASERGGRPEGSAEKGGRPEGSPTTAPIPAPRPDPPKPPELPDPQPGKPRPIPRTLFSVLDVNVDLDLDLPRRPTPGTRPEGPPAPRPVTPPVLPPDREMPRAEGNAVYRIDSAGFVTEVFRQSAAVLCMVEKSGTLLVGTGGEGRIYQISIAQEETVVLAEVDSRQVMALLCRRNGDVIAALANSGGLASMSSGLAAEGTFTSPVLDASQISRWGKLRMNGLLPTGTTLTLATRSGNLQDAEARGWSKWSDEQPASEFVQIASPAARFLQYRLTFATKAPAQSPTVDSVDVAYQMPNLAPQVRSIRVVTAQHAGPRPAEKGEGAPWMRAIAWEADDANDDELEFTLMVRVQGQGPWLTLKDRVQQLPFEWDTRSVPDGKYEVKVIASDARANPRGEGRTGSRVSDLVVVDNTPPAIGEIQTRVDGRNVTLSARVADRTGIVTRVEYSVDSKEDWHAAAASDKILDSPEEGVSLVLEGLSPGPHVIMLRAGDENGNTGYASVTVNIPGRTD